MKNATHLSRVQLQSVLGGNPQQDPCANKTGADLQNCNFNVCMAGWDFNAHDQQANDTKILGCDKQSQSPAV